MEVSVIYFAFYTISCCILQVSTDNLDYYKVLGLSKSASPNDIKRAYRELAKAWHPDKNKNTEASKKFQDLGEAYGVLSDEEKRKKYDLCGVECVKKDMGGKSSDPFASFFGDFFGTDSNDQHETLKGGNVEMKLFVTLDEIFNGNFIELTRNKAVIKEAEGRRKCNCRQEMITKQLGPGRFQMLQQMVCDECPNVKFVNEVKVLEVEVEPGMSDHHKIKFIAEGEPHIDGEPGDLILVVTTLPHNRFRRKGVDLYTNVTISLQDALVGFEFGMKHLDGKKIVIDRPGMTKPGEIMKLPKQGLPSFENNNARGDLYITFDIRFPDRPLSDETKSTLKELFNQPKVNRVYNGLR